MMNLLCAIFTSNLHQIFRSNNYIRLDILDTLLINNKNKVVIKNKYFQPQLEIVQYCPKESSGRYETLS